MIFAVVCITGPVIGIAIGGFIIDKAGGYKSKNILYILTSFGVTAILSGFYIPFIDNYIGVTVLIWMVLATGGAILPSA